MYHSIADLRLAPKRKGQDGQTLEEPLGSPEVNMRVPLCCQQVAR